ncbi:hypothetical protein TSAR_009472 [Trichomalopsis sarcophagae]|uniref:Uncharacterized protein n=1 Tax=Trichomalopsis sarcophagae TaxID=543379 RepID=A0A232FH40_9HYME|nr:hypothetical protein TSAR_009472 [Trichomalopsis sarcophagae]
MLLPLLYEELEMPVPDIIEAEDQDILQDANRGHNLHAKMNIYLDLLNGKELLMVSSAFAASNANHLKTFRRMRKRIKTHRIVSWRYSVEIKEGHLTPNVVRLMLAINVHSLFRNKVNKVK